MEQSIIVSMDFELDPPDAVRDPKAALTTTAGVAIVIEDGRRINLDPAASRSAALVRVVDRQKQLRLPISLELDGDGHLLRLFLPHMSTVSAVRQLERGVVGFSLHASHALHILNDKNNRFDEYHQLLRQVMSSNTIVVVTESDDHVAIDIRMIDLDRSPIIVGVPRSWIQRQLDKLPSWCLCGLPWPLGSAIRQSAAQELFDMLASASCDPEAISEPCIPFLYPDNGCWARAHEMCRLMKLEGYEPCKIWIEGWILTVETANHPFCKVNWVWHVAPTLCRRARWRGITKLFTTERWVFDPSIFDKPVTVDEWKAAMGNPAAVLTMTSWRINHLWAPEQLSHPDQPGRYDDDYESTRLWLRQMRNGLDHRVLSPDFGPPPYDHCDENNP